MDRSGVTPLDLTTHGSACYLFLKFHTDIFHHLQEYPSDLVSAAIVHYASLSASEESVPKAALSCLASQLEPFFHWAPRDGLSMIFTWAHAAYIAQLAAVTEPFLELPDDCAGDIFDFFEIKLARMDALRIATHCSSPEAHSWVAAVAAAAALAKATAKLLQAVEKGDLATAEDCLAKGANIEYKNEKLGHTALIESSRYGHAAIVELLLKAGANTEATSTADEETSLIKATKKGFVSIVQSLLLMGANTEATSKCGMTALSFASLYGHAVIAKLLLKAGANTETNKHKFGSTALCIASESNRPSVVELLLQAGADKNARNTIGDTALMKASRRGYVAVVELLLDAGADTDIQDKKGRTALMFAADRGHIDTVRRLVDTGAFKEAKHSSDGETSLIKAAKKGFVDIVEALLLAGANVEATSKAGHKALDRAQANGHTEVVALFHP